MKLLNPGTGNQFENRKKAIDFICEHVFPEAQRDYKSGNIKTKEGHDYHVSAYAESQGAFISTPGVDRSQYSIYASGFTSLIFRQIKNDDRIFIYEVEPESIEIKTNSSTANWEQIRAASKRMWVCKRDRVLEVSRKSRKLKNDK